MGGRHLGWLLIAAAALSGRPGVAVAHPGVDDRIHQIDHEISKHPRDAHLYLRRGELYAEDRHFDKAEQDFGRAGRLDAELAEVHYYRGAMLLEAQRLLEADGELSKFLEVQPEHVKARFLRARARSGLAQHRGAADDFSAGLAHAPTPTPQPYFERAQSLLALGPGHYHEALEGLDEGCERLGSPIVLVELAVETEIERGDHEAALVRLQALPDKLAHSPHWLKRRGDLLMALDHRVQGLVVYVMALGRVAHLPDARRKSAAMVRLDRELRQAISEAL